MWRWYLGGLALLVLLGGGLALGLTSLPPTTIEAAVEMTLARAGAVTRGVRVTNAQCVPAQETCLSYIADVEVIGQDAVGRLSCTAAWEGCTLWMAELGVHRMPVPLVVPPHPWLRQLATQAHRLDAWLRGVWHAKTP
jgi:hypothetical protein